MWPLADAPRRPHSVVERRAWLNRACPRFLEWGTPAYKISPIHRKSQILAALDPEHHAATWHYVKELRQRLNAQFPHLTFFFQPADIVSQILNSGLPGLAEFKRPDRAKLLAQPPKRREYLAAVQTPQYRIDSIDALQGTQ